MTYIHVQRVVFLIIPHAKLLQVTLKEKTVEPFTKILQKNCTGLYTPYHTTDLLSSLALLTLYTSNFFSSFRSHFQILGQVISLIHQKIQSTQQLGFDFHEFFFPVVKPKTIRTILTLATPQLHISNTLFE